MPRHGARVVRGRGHGAAHERPLRLDQGRSRGAPRRRRPLHERGRLADGPGRLADDRLPAARRPPVLRRHVLPARGARRDALVPAGAGRHRRGLPRAPRRGRAPGRGARCDPAGGAARAAARGLQPHAGDAARRAADAARPARRAQRRIRPRPQVPAALGAHVPAAHAPAQRQRGGARDGAAHAQAHGRRRHPRPARRRLPPLRGRCDLARAALRADALRQRAARARLPGRLAGDRRRAVARGRRGHPRLPAARARARARRLRLGAGRRHRRRRGRDLHLDSRAAARRALRARTPRSPSAPGA